MGVCGVQKELLSSGYVSGLPRKIRLTTIGSSLPNLRGYRCETMQLLWVWILVSKCRMEFFLTQYRELCHFNTVPTHSY